LSSEKLNFLTFETGLDPDESVEAKVPQVFLNRTGEEGPSFFKLAPPNEDHTKPDFVDFAEHTSDVDDGSVERPGPGHEDDNHGDHDVHVHHRDLGNVEEDKDLSNEEEGEEVGGHDEEEYDGENHDTNNSNFDEDDNRQEFEKEGDFKEEGDGESGLLENKKIAKL